MDSILKIQNLKKYFPVEKGLFRKTDSCVRAVDGISLSLGYGKTLGIVGESGCGKTTLGKMILGLLQPASGNIFFENRDISALSKEDRIYFRRKVQIIFQDPFSSLNPKLKIFDIVSEPIKIHKLYPKNEIFYRVEMLLDSVGLKGIDPYAYPRVLSGGQRQRVNIARGLASNPHLLVLDEPVASLDVSMQAQILNLLMDLKEKFSLTFIIISHDLRVIAAMSDDIAVMYMGKIVEQGAKSDIIVTPFHPYTAALLKSGIFSPGSAKDIKPQIKGDIPSMTQVPEGCRFNTRCPLAQFPLCGTEPALEPKEASHCAACHLL